MRRLMRTLRQRRAPLALSLAGATLLSVLTVGLGAPPPAAAAHAPTYYVSLGDSYAAGYQPGKGATPGYATYVAQHTGLKLANFGCPGATTTSLLTTVGCPVVLPGTAGAGGLAYPTTTQMAAATAFLAAQLRAAAGPKVPIIGSTYPDVILGTYVFPTNPASPAALSLANLSVVAFKSLVNPALAQSYASSLGAFVDVTEASGAYASLQRTVHTDAYGTIPVPVASVCTLTWFCAKGDIHPMDRGYALIGKLIVAKYHAMK